MDAVTSPPSIELGALVTGLGRGLASKRLNTLTRRIARTFLGVDLDETVIHEERDYAHPTD